MKRTQASSHLCDLEKNHWRSELEKIVIILSTPRFDEKGNGGPERSGDSPESQQLSSEAGRGFWGWEGEGPGETPQGQAVSAP